MDPASIYLKCLELKLFQIPFERKIYRQFFLRDSCLHRCFEIVTRAIPVELKRFNDDRIQIRWQSFNAFRNLQGLNLQSGRRRQPFF